MCNTKVSINFATSKVRHNKITQNYSHTQIFFTMTQINTYKTYRVMYYFGVWMTHEVIAAESDAEAIFDADMSVANAPAKGKLTYALWQGNRKVKVYNP